MDTRSVVTEDVQVAAKPRRQTYTAEVSSCQNELALTAIHTFPVSTVSFDLTGPASREEAIR